MTDQQKIDFLKGNLRMLTEELSYLKQLRPLVPSEEGYSTPISFEEMSEYALAWMDLMGIKHCGIQWERV